LSSSELPLFIYGSLLDADRRAEIIGRTSCGIPAVLHGYERAKHRYWFIRAREGAIVSGAILTDLTPAELATLDAYEEVPDLYTRERVSVTLAGNSIRECLVYLPTGWERDPRTS
jgi:gamma-glutamylcyclotransferase (GGCT)/AIG2-like uncharacterized protein YtfP